MALRTLFEHYLRAPGRGAGDRPRGRAGAAGDRLSGRNDRPFLPRHVRAAGRRRRDWVDGQVHDRQQGSGQGRRRHRRDRLGVHRSAAARPGLLGVLPVPRRADAVVQGQPAGQALLLLRLRGERGRVPVRGGEGGAGLPRGGRVAGRALRRRARAGERGPAGRGGDGGGGPGCGSCWSGRRSSTSGTCGSRRRRRRRGSTWRSGGWGRRCCGAFGVGMAPSAVGPGADAGASGPGSRWRSCWPRGWCRRGSRAATTTASGPGSCSRSATSAAGCWGSGRGR